MRRAPAEEKRETLDDVLDDLERTRRSVLQDLREIELETAAPPSAAILRQLQRDLRELQAALDASYDVWPPMLQAAPLTSRR